MSCWGIESLHNEYEVELIIDMGCERVEGAIYTMETEELDYRNGSISRNRKPTVSRRSNVQYSIFRIMCD